jgi:hypothetical protein
MPAYGLLPCCNTHIGKWGVEKSVSVSCPNAPECSVLPPKGSLRACAPVCHVYLHANRCVCVCSHVNRCVCACMSTVCVRMHVYKVCAHVNRYVALCLHVSSLFMLPKATLPGLLSACGSACTQEHVRFFAGSVKAKVRANKQFGTHTSSIHKECMHGAGQTWFLTCYCCVPVRWPKACY